MEFLKKFKLSFIYFISMVTIVIYLPVVNAKTGHGIKLVHGPEQYHNYLAYESGKLLLPKEITEYHSPTLNYLKLDSKFKQKVEERYNEQIERIGPDFFARLFNDTIDKDIQYYKTHYGLFHGAQLEFLVL